MSKDGLVRYVAGPLVTLVALALHRVLVQTGWLPVSAAGLSVFVLLAGFVGGLRASLASAAILTIYNVMVLEPMTAERWVVIGSYFVAAGLIGWKSRQWREMLALARENETVAALAKRRAEVHEQAAQAMESLNGNVFRIRTARERLLNVLNIYPLDKSTRTDIREVLHTLNNLEQATAGWRELEKIKQREAEEARANTTAPTM